MVPAIRAQIRGMPSRGENRRRGKPSTRTQLARAVTLQVRPSSRTASVTVFMNPRKMPDGKRSLPSYFEVRPGYTRLRHPVFGRDPWITQQVPPAGYFTRTIGPIEERTLRAVREVVDRMARQIEDQ